MNWINSYISHFPQKATRPHTTETVLTICIYMNQFNKRWAGKCQVISGKKKVEMCFSRGGDVRMETLCSYSNSLAPLMNKRSCYYPDECKPARFVLRAAVDCASTANIISSIPSLWDALLGFGAVMPRSWMWGYSTHYWWHFTISHGQTTGFPEGICIRKKCVRLVCNPWKWQ